MNVLKTGMLKMKTSFVIFYNHSVFHSIDGFVWHHTQIRHDCDKHIRNTDSLVDSSGTQTLTDVMGRHSDIVYY